MFAVSAALPIVLRPFCLELDTCCIQPHVTSSAPHFYFSFFSLLPNPNCLRPGRICMTNIYSYQNFKIKFSKHDHYYAD